MTPIVASAVQSLQARCSSTSCQPWFGFADPQPPAAARPTATGFIITNQCPTSSHNASFPQARAACARASRSSAFVVDRSAMRISSAYSSAVSPVRNVTRMGPSRISSCSPVSIARSQNLCQLLGRRTDRQAELNFAVMGPTTAMSGRLSVTMSNEIPRDCGSNCAKRIMTAQNPPLFAELCSEQRAKQKVCPETTGPTSVVRLCRPTGTPTSSATLLLRGRRVYGL